MLDLTVPSTLVTVNAPSPYARDGQISAWSLPSRHALAADLGVARFVTDLVLRLYASQDSTLEILVDGTVVLTLILPAGQTRTLTRTDLPRLPWTFQTLQVQSRCATATSACALVPGLSLSLLPPRDPGAPSVLFPAALLGALALTMAWRHLHPWDSPR
ncbi:hypothetical protein E7T09_08940 [Deinococcus sp. KSM4-11]|uniref:hypothetical protein n=1 Tax=Deinococcus sp. KSM4-11 TaxID=2568654 RepID=UPI0010A5155D|nr:hypothetical protein [Deinococcus sp. KSM4-11]THF87259.1 hypothetical protein E7T09_08940 [Deinococcus sp. KSM4-11]